MPTTRIKEKLSTLVSSQLPEFIQSDYTTFKAFLEAYYEFLEQDQNAQELLQNARSYNDIDRTVSSFVEYFLKQYCDDIPRDVLYNKKALVKNIQDLYNSKGSEKSYKLLFRILYNKDIDVFYPSTQILRTSDGKWVQNYSFFLRTIVGDGTTIIGKTPLLVSVDQRFSIFIKSRKNTSTTNGVSDTIHEYYYDNSKNIPIKVGDIIEYAGFKGEVVGSPVQAIITTPGTGFKIGDILTLTSGLGNTAKLKVTKVDSSGGIQNVQFINFGVGYAGDFYNFFSAVEGKVSVTSFDFTSGTASINESLNGFVERGTITTASYANTGFFAEDYQGELLREFFTSTSTIGSTGTGQPTTGVINTSSGLTSDASIYVSLGASTRYPGYYKNNDGFLSDDIFLEDRDYYQPFSYVIRVDERLSLYKKVILDLLHPAGTKLFGDLTLISNIDISSEILATLRYLTSNLQDVIGAAEGLIAKDVVKPVFDSVIPGEFVAKHIDKPRSDTIDLIKDEEFYNLTKATESLLATSDDGNYYDYTKVIGFNEIQPYTTGSYFAEDYVVTGATNFIGAVDDSFDAELERFIYLFQEINDNGLTFIYSGYTTLNDYFQEDYVGEWLPSILLDITKVVESSLATVDSFRISGSNNYFTETLPLISSNATISVGVNSSDTVPLQESVSFTSINNLQDNYTTAESGYVLLSDYAANVYFATDYVGTYQHTF